MGVLPSAVTTARPEWVSFTIQAGRVVPGDPRERRFGELRQLTFDGTTGSARWHPDGHAVIYESGRSATSCGHLRRLDLASGKSKQLSPAGGWAALGAFAANGSAVLYAFAKTDQPPCTPSFSGLRWTLPHCDIVTLSLSPATKTDGSKSRAPARVLVQSPTYDGDVDTSSDGQHLVFTSMRDGDPDLYVAAADGRGVKRITAAPGYDGGARFSPDGSKLTWHAERIGEDAVAAYQEQLAQGRVTPRSLQILQAGSEGQRARVVVAREGYNITPTFLPDSRRLLFASDYDDPGSTPGQGRDFELYLVDPDGPVTATGAPRVERVTFHDGFDGNGQFSPDGRQLLFTSSRLSSQPGGTDLYLVRWLDGPEFQ